MKKIKSKMIYGIIIFIILFNILAITGNAVFATGTNNNVIYQKKVEILSTPVIDTKNTNITSNDTDIREEEQKEEELKKEAEERRKKTEGNTNTYMIIIGISIPTIVIVLILIINAKNNKEKEKALKMKNIRNKMRK